LNFYVNGEYGPPITSLEEFTLRVAEGSFDIMSDLEVLKADVMEFLNSRERADIALAENYYKGYQDITDYERVVINELGQPEKVEFLPNHPTVDNQYSIHTDKKTDYSFSKDFSLAVGEGMESYKEQLERLFSNRHRKIIKSLARSAISSGVAYLYPCIDRAGRFTFRKLDPTEIRPIFYENELIAFYRVYDDVEFRGKDKKLITRIEYYDYKGVNFFKIEDGDIYPDVEKETVSHLTVDIGGAIQQYNWVKPPLVIFRSNEIKQGMIHRVKTLQDGINLITTLFINNTEEDVRSTILVLKNYSGQDGRRFRRDLAKYGTINVETLDGVSGGVETLKIDVNPENYKAILEVLKRAFIENARSFDSKMDKMGDANQMNIQSMYSDIDLDADDIESEFKVSLEELIWFYNQYLGLTGQEYSELPVDFIFNRDVLMNEAQAIQMCVDSKGLISDRTILENHPWVKDVEEELKEVEKQKSESLKIRAEMFGVDTEQRAWGGDEVDE